MLLLLACEQSGDAADSSSTGDLEDDSGDTTAPLTTTGMTSLATTEPESSSFDPGFIVEPDGGPVEGECDLWAQDCPAGDKCMPWADQGGDVWNATRCTPIDPDSGQPGDACTVEDSGTSGIDTCDIGAMCWDVDPETLEGTCAAMCEGSPLNPICEDPDTACILANGGVLNVCLALCDPLLQPCPEGQACYPIPTGFVCGPDVSHELGGYADACAFVNGCDPGLFCAASGFIPGCRANNCCTPFCDLEEPDASAMCPGSADGQECVPYFPSEPPPGYETVGACAIPQ